MTTPAPGPSSADGQRGLWLPGLEDPASPPYGARSDDSELAGDQLMQYVPALARGDVEIVAIARRVGVLTKVAVRRRRGPRLGARPTSLVAGLGADYVNRVSEELGGERLHVLQWQGDPARYVANALGLWISATDRDLAVDAAGKCAAWRYRCSRCTRSPRCQSLARVGAHRVAHPAPRNIRFTSWRALEIARQERRSVPAVVQALVPKGLAVAIYGLNGLLPTGQVHGVRRNTSPTTVGAILRERLGHEIHVRVLRMDPDAGHIFVSERAGAGWQLRLFR